MRGEGGALGSVKQWCNANIKNCAQVAVPGNEGMRWRTFQAVDRISSQGNTKSDGTKGSGWRGRGGSSTSTAAATAAAL